MEEVILIYNIYGHSFLFEGISDMNVMQRRIAVLQCEQSPDTGTRAGCLSVS